MTLNSSSSKLIIGILIVIVNIDLMKCTSFGFDLIHVFPNDNEKDSEDFVEDELNVNDLLNLQSTEVANNEAIHEKLSSRYSVHVYARPWFDAVTACWREDGQLATPSDETDALVLGRLLKAAADSGNVTNTQMMDAMHVGVNNLWMRGDLFSTEGEEINYISWFKGGKADIPLVDFPEQCVSLLTNGQYMQHHCGDKLIYVCDHKKRDEDYKEHSLEAKYKPMGGEGLYRLHMEPMPWLEGEGICEKEGGHLATPSSGREAGFLSGILFSRSDLPPEVRAGGVYVGINDLVSEGVWRDIKGEHAYHLDIWSPNRPSNNRSSNCAVMLRSGHLTDVSCSESKAFLCEKKVEDEIPEYVQLEDLGWYFLHTDEKTWLQAAVHCHLENASLTVINSEKEAQMLDIFIREILLKTNKPHFEALVGIQKLDGRKWRTIDGVSLDKSGFSELNSSSFPSLLVCGGFYEAKYVETLCGRRSIYVCERPL